MYDIPDIDHDYLESDETSSVRFEKLISKHKSNHFFYSVFRRRDLVELINGGSLKDFRAADWHFVDKLALAENKNPQRENVYKKINNSESQAVIPEVWKNDPSKNNELLHTIFFI